MEFGLVGAALLAAIGTAPRDDAPCTAPLVLPTELAERPARFIILGETHGTDTSPEAFGDLVCSQSVDTPVLVQFELPKEWGELIDAYVATGDTAKLDELLATPLFAGRRYDGRTSSAFLSLIRRLRAMAEAGRSVRVAGFQPSWFSIAPQYYYELDMAHGLARRAAEHEGAINLVLVGSYHARRSAPADERYSAASFLRDEDYIALRVCPEGGTASTLTRDGEAIRELDDIAAGTARGIYAPSHFELSALRDQRLFDGYVCVGRPATASPRAVPQAE